MLFIFFLLKTLIIRKINTKDREKIYDIPIYTLLSFLKYNDNIKTPSVIRNTTNKTSHNLGSTFDFKMSLIFIKSSLITLFYKYLYERNINLK